MRDGLYYCMSNARFVLLISVHWQYCYWRAKGRKEKPTQSFAQNNPDGNDPIKGMKETFIGGIVKCNQGIQMNRNYWDRLKDFTRKYENILNLHKQQEQVNVTTLCNISLWFLDFYLKAKILLKSPHLLATCRESFSLWSAITTTIAFPGNMCQSGRNTAHNSGYSAFPIHVQNKTFISQAYAGP